MVSKLWLISHFVRKRAKKKKINGESKPNTNGAQEFKASNAVYDLCWLVDVQEIDDCRFETLFCLLIFGFWYYEIMVAVKIRDKWKEIEDFWCSLSESKIRSSILPKY